MILGCFIDVCAANVKEFQKTNVPVQPHIINNKEKANKINNIRYQKMTKMNPSITAIILIAMMGFLRGDVFCASSEEFNEMDYSYGKVQSASAQEIIIAEYDYEKDQEINVTYKIDSAVELQNINSLSDLAAGDEVEIYYDDKNGGKTARIISRPQVEDGPVETDDDESIKGGDNASSNKEGESFPQAWGGAH